MSHARALRLGAWSLNILSRKLERIGQRVIRNSALLHELPRSKRYFASRPVHLVLSGLEPLYTAISEEQPPPFVRALLPSLHDEVLTALESAITGASVRL